jgi:hypothetical protein
MMISILHVAKKRRKEEGRILSSIIITVVSGTSTEATNNASRTAREEVEYSTQNRLAPSPSTNPGISFSWLCLDTLDIQDREEAYDYETPR